MPKGISTDIAVFLLPKFKVMKQITPTGEMSNLVGMYAIIFREKQYEGTTYNVYISGKATVDTFIVQAIGGLTGAPNVARLVHIDQMKDWLILPTKEIAEQVLSDWSKQGYKEFRFKFDI